MALPKKALVKAKGGAAAGKKGALAKPGKNADKIAKKGPPKKDIGGKNPKDKKGKGKKGKKGKRKKRKKKKRRCPIKRRKKAIKRKCTDMFASTAMFNLYYIAHAVPDALKIRKFIWKKKKK